MFDEHREKTATHNKNKITFFVCTIIHVWHYLYDFTFLGDEEDGKEEGEVVEQTLPSCADYVMHYLSLFWKLLFATVPPTGNILYGYRLLMCSQCVGSD